MGGEGGAATAGLDAANRFGNGLRHRLSRLLRAIVEGGRFPPPTTGCAGAPERRDAALVLVVEACGAGEIVDRRRAVPLRRDLLEPGEQLLLRDGIQDLVGPFELDSVGLPA